MYFILSGNAAWSRVPFSCLLFMFTLYVTLSRYHAVLISTGGAAAPGWSCRRVGAQPRREIRRSPCNTGAKFSRSGRGRVVSTIKASYTSCSAERSLAADQWAAPGAEPSTDQREPSRQSKSATDYRVGRRSKWLTPCGDGTSRPRVVPVCPDSRQLNSSLARAWWWYWLVAWRRWRRWPTPESRFRVVVRRIAVATRCCQWTVVTVVSARASGVSPGRRSRLKLLLIVDKCNIVSVSRTRPHHVLLPSTALDSLAFVWRFSACLSRRHDRCRVETVILFVSCVRLCRPVGWTQPWPTRKCFSTMSTNC